MRRQLLLRQQQRVEVMAPLLAMVAQRRLQVIQRLLPIIQSLQLSEASHSALLEKVTQLLQAQTEAMTAQAHKLQQYSIYLPSTVTLVRIIKRMTKCSIGGWNISKNVQS